MRLIDADALIQKRVHAKAFGPEMYVIGQGYVMDAPTVDAVPVPVRCKDCTYVRCNGDIHCLRTGASVFGDDFCSYGERKDGEPHA